MEGFTNPQKNLLVQSMLSSENVLNWKDWQDAVVLSCFKETVDSGRTVLGKLCAADVVVNVTKFHSLSNTIAYTFLHGNLIDLNDYYLDKYVGMESREGGANVASTVIHEVMHQMGYTHRRNWTRMSSVPYQMQHIFYQYFLKYYKPALIQDIKKGMDMNVQVSYLNH